MSQGAATTVACALMPYEDLAGGYFSDCSAKKKSRLGSDEDAAKLLWQMSEELVAAAAAAAAAATPSVEESRL